MKKAGDSKGVNKQFNLMAAVNKAYSALPSNMQLAVDKITNGLSEFGPRNLGYRGIGSEFLQPRDYRPGIDERRDINARLSARAGRKIVTEKEAEIRQRIYLCVDESNRMDYASQEGTFTKKESSEIMCTALAKHLTKNDDLVEFLDSKNFPQQNRKFLPNSTVILFSDFLIEPRELSEELHKLSAVGLNGFLVMVMDPQEVDFNFEGFYEFEGMDNDLIVDPGDRAENLREEYRKEIRNHIEEVEKTARDKGFRFIFQRTDSPLYEGIMQIYGMPVSRQLNKESAYKR